MKFSEMKPKQLKEARDRLKELLKNTLNPSRISSLTDRSVYIEGGHMPACYDHYPRGGQLSVWCKGGNNYSGKQMSVDELKEAELVIHRFYMEHISREEN